MIPVNVKYISVHEVSIKITVFCSVTSYRLVVTYKKCSRNILNFCGDSDFLRKFSEPTYTPN